MARDYAGELKAQYGAQNIDPNYGLLEAKRRWKEANLAGNQAGMAEAAEMGQQFRRLGATLDPNNQMDYDQANKAYNQQFMNLRPSSSAASASAPSYRESPAVANLRSMLGRIQGYGQFNYNPETDPRYNAMKQLIANESKDASQRTMEQLNARGILRSTITGDRLAQIQQQGADKLAASVPQLYGQAYNEWQGGLKNLYSQLQAEQGLADREDRLAQQGFQNQMASGNQQFQQNMALENLRRALEQQDWQRGQTEKSSKLNLLNVLSGLTGRIPQGYEDYGLTPGEETAAERNRRLAYELDRIRANATSTNKTSLKNQLLDYVLSGGDTSKLTTNQRKLLGLSTPENPNNATIEAMKKLISAPSREDALKALEREQTVLKLSGVDIDTLKEEINRVFPVDSGNGSGIIDWLTGQVAPGGVNFPTSALRGLLP